jgi:hypothetical protein
LFLFLRNWIENMFITKKIQYAISLALLLTLSAPGYAKPSQAGHKPSNRPSQAIHKTAKPTHKPANRPNHVIHRPAKPSHKPVTVIHKPVHKPHHRPVVIVHKPSHRSYHRNNLPRTATFIMVAGISYALINNAYYKNNNDTYEYVEPPIAATLQNSANQGTVVNTIPQDAQTVVVNGTTYYVDNSDWYAPIAASNLFVIVAPQV